MLLAFETATNICSVAFKNRKGEVFEKRSETHGSHSENLFLFIRELMNEHGFKLSDLKAVLVSEGPGSYTGLRIAASGVKGLLYGSEVQLYGMNTLASFAMAAAEKHSDAAKIHSVIDARRKHLYHQSFSLRNKQLTAIDSVAIRPIEKIEQMIKPKEVIIGTGLERIDEVTRQKGQLMDKKHISGRSLIQLFETVGTDSFHRKVNPADFSPQYYSSKKPQINAG